VSEPLDLNAALKALEGDRELLRRIAQIFLVQSPKLLEDVRDAVARGDAVALELAAHKVRGSLTNFGSRKAHDAAWRLEQMGRVGDLTGGLEAQSELESAVCELERLLVEFSRVEIRENTDCRR
jgi:HPt (histidine-containing phosphotransfer) domain-containing protein